MNSNTQSATDLINNGDNYKLYKYRWVVLLLFCLYSCTNYQQYLQYSIITNIIARYYNVSTFAVSWTSLVFMICYIVLFLPVSYTVEIYNLRQISIVASSLTAIGVAVKLFVSPGLFYVVLIGQTFCAVAQVFMMSLPSKLANIWFGKDEVSTACAFAIVGTQLGAALGCIVSPNVVKNHDSIDDIGAELFNMTLYTAIVTFVICILVVLFFRAEPKTPPSQSQALLTLNGERNVRYIASLKILVKNRGYLILLVAMGMSNGIWNAFGIELNTIYLQYFPNGEQDAGLLALIALLAGGCIGSILFGYILDKTHKFKLIAFALLFLATIGIVGTVFALEQRDRTSVFAAGIIFGFFLAATLVIGFEYATELTYPEPESTSIALMNAVIFLFGLIFAISIDALIPEIGTFWTGIAIAAILGVSSLMVLLIPDNLRRLRANLVAEMNEFST